MKSGLVLAVAVVLLRGGVPAPMSSEAQPIKLRDIQQRNILGSLGHNLGEIVTIEGTVVDGADLMEKRLSCDTLLKVETVQGKKRKDEVILQFRPYLPSVDFGLKPGTKFRLVAYETGQFVGMPEGSFKHVGPLQTTGFFFETSLVVLKNLHTDKRR